MAIGKDLPLFNQCNEFTDPLEDFSQAFDSVHKEENGDDPIIPSETVTGIMML